jgi:hypothetical protein
MRVDVAFLCGWLTIPLLGGCAATRASETELRITHPSVLEADFVDAQGHRITEFTPASAGAGSGSAAVPIVRVFAGGFTPVKRVYVVSDELQREVSMERKGDKLFEVALTELMKPDEIARHAGGFLTVRIIAVDIENDQTASDSMELKVLPAH